MYIRLNKECNSIQEVNVYYQDRARQLMSDNISWCGEVYEFKDLGCFTYFYRDYAKPYVSFYVYKNKRGNNGFKQFIDEWWQNNKYYNFITVNSCDLEEYFIKSNIPYHKAQTMENEYCYSLISEFYQNKTAKRTGVPYMNHIDEGIAIMKYFDFSREAILGYCLHPLYQTDYDLKRNFQNQMNILDDPLNNLLEKKPHFLALEYRNIANSYLAHREIKSIKDISLSPIQEVNQMLIADKIQNYKDFMKYHYLKHEKSKELYRYFHNWFDALNLDVKEIYRIMPSLDNFQTLSRLKYNINK